MSNEKKSIFARNLIAIRKAKGISQRDLANLSGISSRVIAYYETNSSIPSIDKLEKLATVLDVSMSDLIDPKKSDKETLKLNTRTIKKIQLLEKLTTEDQKKVMDYIKLLLKNKEVDEIKKQLQDSNK